MNEKLRAQLSRDEGRVAHAYQDSLGYWTAGVGHLLDARKGGKLPEHIIDALLDYDIEEHTKGLLAKLPWVADLDPPRQAVLINMAFNLGVQGLLTFENTLAMVKTKQFDAAAEAMLKSKWATQVGPRATRLALQMRSGEWQ